VSPIVIIIAEAKTVVHRGLRQHSAKLDLASTWLLPDSPH
jgi:hypothetical protein